MENGRRKMRKKIINEKGKHENEKCKRKRIEKKLRIFFFFLL